MGAIYFVGGRRKGNLSQEVQIHNNCSSKRKRGHALVAMRSTGKALSTLKVDKTLQHMMVESNMTWRPLSWSPRSHPPSKRWNWLKFCCRSCHGVWSTTFTIPWSFASCWNGRIALSTWYLKTASESRLSAGSRNCPCVVLRGLDSTRCFFPMFDWSLQSCRKYNFLA